MTKQYLKKRIYQHSYDCREINKNKNEKTALAMHHFDNNHDFDFEKVKILDRENNYFKRCISEMIQISINDTINLRSDVESLSIVYSNLLTKIKKLEIN